MGVFYPANIFSDIVIDSVILSESQFGTDHKQGSQMIMFQSVVNVLLGAIAAAIFTYVFVLFIALGA